MISTMTSYPAALAPAFGSSVRLGVSVLAPAPAPAPAPRRALALHEYQSKELMRKHGVAAQKGWTAATPEGCEKAAQQMLKEGIKSIVVKAQVLAGGRGKGTLSSGLKGGVQFTRSPAEVKQLAEKMIGFQLTTHQTGPEGLLVSKLLLHEGVKIEKELYLAIVLDRGMGGPVLMASRMGGVDIEEVAEKTPEAIVKVPVDILKGPGAEEVEAVVRCLLPSARESLSAATPRGKEAEVYEEMKQKLRVLIERLYGMFVTTDSSQVEINPLALTDDNDVLCVDAKLGFDDNASYRQKELFDQEDVTVRDQREVEAEKFHLNFVAMDGSIGCLVNGAGLAMATMDIIALNGGRPANFLDLGGGATKEQVKKSLEIITSDPNVKTIFVNIFGGITRCDTIASGIVEAARDISLKQPLVVRLVGNNAAEAKKILNDPSFVKTSTLKIIAEDDFATAAKIACGVAKLLA